MKIEQKRINRREFIALSSAAGAAGLLSSIPGAAQAADFPSRKMQTYIPTRAGGGADRNFRAFSGVWSKHLGIDFEPGFFPGAAGRVGYETYMAKAADDCHDLIFGNMGPEVLNWVVKKPSFDLGAYQYIIQVDADPGSIFINTNSSMKTIDDVIAEGKKTDAHRRHEPTGPPGLVGDAGACREDRHEGKSHTALGWQEHTQWGSDW